MGTECPTVVRGVVWRLTRLDDCGVPVVGTSTTVVGNFISIAKSPQYENSDPIRVTGADGGLCINEPGVVNLAQTDLTIILCTQDPDAINIMTGSPVVLDAATPTPNRVGYRQQCGKVTAKFAIEVWSEIGGQSCSGGAKKYYYTLYPMVTNAQFGDDTIENGANQLTITASAFCNSGWGVGPYDVVPDATNAPGPLLTAMAANQLSNFETTTVAPPTPACGAVALAA
jgi:hypothetical protein